MAEWQQVAKAVVRAGALLETQRTEQLVMSLLVLQLGCSPVAQQGRHQPLLWRGAEMQDEVFTAGKKERTQQLLH